MQFSERTWDLLVRRGSPDLVSRSKVLGSARPSNGERPLGPALLRPCHQSRAMPGVAWHGKCSRFLSHETKLHFCHCQWASDRVLCIACHSLSLAQSILPLPYPFLSCSLLPHLARPEKQTAGPHCQIHTVRVQSATHPSFPANQPWARLGLFPSTPTCFTPCLSLTKPRCPLGRVGGWAG